MPSDPCQELVDEVAGIDSDILALSDELREATPSMKAGILQRIRALRAASAQAAQRLSECRGQHPLPPPPPTLFVTDSGQAVIWLDDPQILELFPQEFSLDLVLQGQLGRLNRLQITPITLQYKLPIIGAFSVIVDVVKTSINERVELSAQGVVSITGLRIEFRNNLPFVHNSELAVDLTTEAAPQIGSANIDQLALAGTRLDKHSGWLSLVGTGRLRGGPPDGQAVAIELSGTLSPIPN